MLDSVENKFGKVFVRKAEHVAGNKSDGDYVLLEGARFCNLQLKVIPGNPSQKEYKGRKFSFGVLGQKLDPFFPLGMNITKSKEELITALKSEIEMAKKLKLVTGEEGSAEYELKCTRIKKTFAGFIMAVCVPENDYMEDEFGHLINMYVQTDDIMESQKDAENNNVRSEKDRRKCSYKITCQIAQVFSEALDAVDPDKENPFLMWLEDPTLLLKTVSGERMGLEKLTPWQTEELRKLLRLHVSLVSSIWKSALEYGLKNDCSPKPFLNEMSRIIRAICFEYSQEWNCSVMSEANWMLMLPTVSFQRVTTISVVFFFEAVLLHRGISVAEKVRQSSLFQLMYYHLSVHCSKLNDLMSFKKEMEGDGNEWRNNQACMLYKTGQMTESEAMSKLAQDVNGAKDQVEILGHILVKTWKGSKEETQVKNFVLALMRYIEAYIRWYGMVDRYHENLIMDCFIDE